MLATKIKIATGGRLIIPIHIRKAMDIEIGDELLMKVENQELKIFNLNHAIQEAQSLMAKHNPQKIKLSEEIIQDRRREEN